MSTLVTEDEGLGSFVASDQIWMPYETFWVMCLIKNEDSLIIQYVLFLFHSALYIIHGDSTGCTKAEGKKTVDE